jgi:hypothetical protein
LRHPSSAALRISLDESDHFFHNHRTSVATTTADWGHPGIVTVFHSESAITSGGIPMVGFVALYESRRLRTVTPFSNRSPKTPQPPVADIR